MVRVFKPKSVKIPNIPVSDNAKDKIPILQHPKYLAVYNVVKNPNKYPITLAISKTVVFLAIIPISPTIYLPIKI